MEQWTQETLRGVTEEPETQVAPETLAGETPEPVEVVEETLAPEQRLMLEKKIVGEPMLSGDLENQKTDGRD